MSKADQAQVHNSLDHTPRAGDQSVYSWLIANYLLRCIRKVVKPATVYSVAFSLLPSYRYTCTAGALTRATAEHLTAAEVMVSHVSPQVATVELQLNVELASGFTNTPPKVVAFVRAGLVLKNTFAIFVNIITNFVLAIVNQSFTTSITVIRRTISFRLEFGTTELLRT